MSDLKNKLYYQSVSKFHQSFAHSLQEILRESLQYRQSGQYNDFVIGSSESQPTYLFISHL